MKKAGEEKSVDKKSTDKLDEILKYEVVSELGLFEKVKTYGWKSLSSKETGRIGGLVTKKKKLMQMSEGQQIPEAGV